MIYQLLNAVIHLVLYAVMIGGSLYLLKGLLKIGFDAARQRWYGLYQRRALEAYSATVGAITNTVTNSEKVRVAFSFTSHLRNLAAGALPMQSDQAAMNLLVYGSFALAGIVYVAAYTAVNKPLLAITPAVVALVLPYITLLVLKRRAGIKNSYELPQFAESLLQNYRRKRGNVIYALNDTNAQMPNSPLRRASVRLTARLQKFTTDIEAFEAMEDFAKQTNTNLATRIAFILFDRYSKGVDIEPSLAFLCEEIKDVQNAIEGSQGGRRENMWLAYLPLGIWPLGMWGLTKAMGDRTWYFQFNTPQGIKDFTILLIVFFAAAAVATAMSRPKQDL